MNTGCRGAVSDSSAALMPCRSASHGPSSSTASSCDMSPTDRRSLVLNSMTMAICSGDSSKSPRQPFSDAPTTADPWSNAHVSFRVATVSEGME